MKKKIYIASPLGFSEAGRFYMHNVLYPLIDKSGYDILDPWISSGLDIKEILSARPSDLRNSLLRDIDFKIASINLSLIGQSDAIVAVLDGTDVDSGVASEIGYGSAMGLPIVGYRGDTRLSSDNSGTLINLQVEYCILRSKGLIVTEDWRIPLALGKIFENQE